MEELTLNEIGEYFIGSEEFQATNDGLDDSGFIDLMYANVLERSADVEGKAYWVEQLASGDSQGAVLIGFTESEESLALM